MLAMMLASDEVLQGAGVSRARSPSASQAIGMVGLAITLWLWVTMTRGAHAIDRLITGYEQTHGPLDLSNGTVLHDTPAIRQLCDDLVATADYFYPFAWLLFLVAAASWCLFSALALQDQATLMVMSWATAIFVLVVLLALYAAPVHEMTIITE